MFADIYWPAARAEIHRVKLWILQMEHSLEMPEDYRGFLCTFPIYADIYIYNMKLMPMLFRSSSLHSYFYQTLQTIQCV